MHKPKLGMRDLDRQGLSQQRDHALHLTFAVCWCFGSFQPQPTRERCNCFDVSKIFDYPFSLSSVPLHLHSTYYTRMLSRLMTLDFAIKICTTKIKEQKSKKRSKKESNRAVTHFQPQKRREKISQKLSTFLPTFLSRR